VVPDIGPLNRCVCVPEIETISVVVEAAYHQAAAHTGQLSL